MQPILDIVNGFRVVKHPTHPGYCVLNPRSSYSYEDEGDYPYIIANWEQNFTGSWIMINDDSSEGSQVFHDLDEIDRIPREKRGSYANNDYGVEASPLREHIRCPNNR